LGESKFQGPVPYLRNQLVAIELSAFDRHAPIVKTLLWPDENATLAFAKQLARKPELRNAFITLHGDLGTGKTTLVRHLLRAAGVQGRIKSPTYAVVEPHQAGSGETAWPIWHFDFYRFSDPREWADAGFRDIFAGPGLKLMEWPDKVAGQLPPADWVIELNALDEDQRQVHITAQTPHGQQWLQAWQEASSAS